MMKKIIVNADDFGISPGVNQAIAESYKNGILNSTSIMINLPCAEGAINLYRKELRGLSVGLHTNLTNERPVSDPKNITLLVNSEGKFKNGFVKLFVLSLICPKKFKKQIEIEVEAQIVRAEELGIKLSHIDGHRHVQMIPGIFKIIKKLTKKHNIGRIRVINENIFYTIVYNRNFSFLWDGGLLKYIILKSFALWNNYKTDTYFYSILYTGKIFRNKLRKLKVPKRFSAVEIGVHPSIRGVDTDDMPCIFDRNVFSENRFKEMETVLDRTVLDDVN